MEHAVIEFMKYLKLKSLDGTNIVKRCRASSINIIRYADNFVILHENKFVIKSCKEFIQNFLLNLGLKLKDTKTRICHTLYDFEDQPVRFDFLGFNIHQYLIGKFAVRKTKVALNFRTLIRPSKSKIKDHFGEITLEEGSGLTPHAVPFGFGGPTGQAYIYSYPDGDNSIILMAGANHDY